jgi:hypothetical protein
MTDLAEITEPVILCTLVFDDEIRYGFNDLWVSVENHQPRREYQYEQWFTLHE